MNIIKSKYMAKQIEAVCTNREKKQEILAHRLVRLTIIITIVPYILWAVFLFCQIITGNTLYTWIAIACLLIGATTNIWIKKLMDFLVYLFVDEKFLPYSHSQYQSLLKYKDDLFAGENLMKLKGTNEISFLLRGNSKVIFVKMENGEEELIPLSDEFVFSGTDVLDFSCHDEKIDKIFNGEK